jgi:hypothetical protein
VTRIWLHALLRNVERITHGFNYNKATVILFLYIERAFDKVWPTGLIAKLIAAKTPPHLLLRIHNYLHNCIVLATCEISYSSVRPIQSRVPQDSLLGHTPFNIYINDIPSDQNDPNVAISFFADDTNISVWSGSIDIAVRKLNAPEGLLEPWFRKLRIKINTQKCAITLFSRRLRHYRRSPCPVMIIDENIAWTSEKISLALHSFLN